MCKFTCKNSSFVSIDWKSKPNGQLSIFSSCSFDVMGKLFGSLFFSSVNLPSDDKIEGKEEKKQDPDYLNIILCQSDKFIQILDILHSIDSNVSCSSASWTYHYNLIQVEIVFHLHSSVCVNQYRSPRNLRKTLISSHRFFPQINKTNLSHQFNTVSQKRPCFSSTVEPRKSKMFKISRDKRWIIQNISSWKPQTYLDEIKKPATSDKRHDQDKLLKLKFLIDSFDFQDSTLDDAALEQLQTLAKETIESRKNKKLRIVRDNFKEGDIVTYSNFPNLKAKIIKCNLKVAKIEYAENPFDSQGRQRDTNVFSASYLKLVHIDME